MQSNSWASKVTQFALSFEAWGLKSEFRQRLRRRPENDRVLSFSSSPKVDPKSRQRLRRCPGNWNVLVSDSLHQKCIQNFGSTSPHGRVSPPFVAGFRHQTMRENARPLPLCGQRGLSSQAILSTQPAHQQLACVDMVQLNLKMYCECRKGNG